MGIRSIVARGVPRNRSRSRLATRDCPAILFCVASKDHAAGELQPNRSHQLARESLAGDALAAAPQFPALFRWATDLAGRHLDAVGGTGLAGVPADGIIA